MPAIVTTSIGSRTSDSVTVSAVTSTTVTGFTNAWTVTLSATVPATTKVGDKLTQSSNNYLIYAISGSDLTLVSDTSIPATTTAIAPQTGSATTSRMYSTIQLHCEGVTSSLVAKDWIWRGELYKEGTGTNGEWVSTTTIGGGAGYNQATDTTRYYELTTATGQSFRDHPDKNTNRLQYNPANGVAIRTTNNYNWLFNSSNSSYPLLKISNIQCKLYREQTNTNYITLEFKNCIIVGNVGGGTKATNCLIVGSVVIGYDNAYRNCTFFWLISSRIAIPFTHPVYSQNLLVKNCAIFNFNYGSPLNTNSSTGRVLQSDSGNNVTDSQNFGWTNASNVTLADPTAQFQEIRSITGSTNTQLQTYVVGTEDFRVRRGSRLIGAGVRDQANTNDVDILGNPRSTTAPTVGCHEFLDTYYSNKKSSIQIGRVGKPYLTNRTKQPKGPVQLDNSHPLRSKIVAVYLASAGPFNLLTLKDRPQPQANTPIQPITPYGDGLSWYNASVDSGLILSSEAASWGTANDYWSILWVGYSGTPRFPDGGRIFGWRGCHLFVTNAGAIRLSGWTTTAGTQNSGLSDTSFWTTTPKKVVISGCSLPTGLFVAINGAVRSSNTGVSAPYIGTETGLSGFSIGAAENTFTFSGGRTELGVVFKNGVSVEDHIKLHSNPWQLFKPASSKIYTFGYDYSENTRPRSTVITSKINGEDLTVVDSNLRLHLDAAQQRSYPGTGTAWTDLSGNGNTGTLVGGPTFSNEGGGVIVFDGVDDYVTLGTPTSLTSLSTVITINAWIYLVSKPVSFNTWSYIYGTGYDAGGSATDQTYFRFSGTSGNLELGSYKLTNRVLSYSSNNFTLNTWYMVTGIWDNSIATLYSNETQVAQANIGAMFPGSVEITLGAFKNGTSYQRFFNGRIGNIQIYNRALSAQEIANLYNQTKNRFTNTIDCATSTYFTKTITGNTTLALTNVPSTGVYKFALRLTVNSGTVTWWSGVTWPESNAPYLTPGKSHLLIFQTRNGGTSWRGSYVLDYAS